MRHATVECNQLVENRILELLGTKCKVSYKLPTLVIDQNFTHLASNNTATSDWKPDVHDVLYSYIVTHCPIDI